MPRLTQVSSGQGRKKRERRLGQRGRKELASLGHWGLVSSGDQAG